LLIIEGTTRMFLGLKKTHNCSPYFNVRERQYPKTPGQPFYQQPPAKMAFFAQYYWFYLSIFLISKIWD
jgi:hypothetical protein